jgi:hypothetical protein
MGFAEFDVCILDDDEKPGPLLERKANTTHPVVGETIDVGPKTYRVVKVHHREVPGERPPRDRAVCYLVEVKKVEIVRDGSSSTDASSSPAQGNLLRFPSNAPPATASVEADFSDVMEVPAEKRVRAAGSIDPHTATTVQRAVSMSMAEHSLSLMKTAPFARGAVPVPSNGGVMKSIHDVAQLPTPVAEPRHFTEEPSVRGEKTTLRVVVRPAPAPASLPITRPLRPPVTKTEPVTPPRSSRGIGIIAGLGVGTLLALMAGVGYVRLHQSEPVDAIVIPTQAAPEPATPALPTQPAPSVEAPAPAAQAAGMVTPPSHAHRRHKEAKKADSNVAPERAGDEDEPNLEGDSLHNPFSR